MKQRLIVFSMLTVIGLAGCVPDAATYYRPTMDGAEARSGACQGMKSHIYFLVGAVPFEAVAQEGANGIVSVILGLPAPARRQNIESKPWGKFHFSSSHFVVRDPDSGHLMENVTVQVFRDDQSESVVEPYAWRNGRESFSLMIHLPAGSPKRFELLSPPIIVDGWEIPFPVLRFEKGVWVGVAPFNC